MKLFTTINNKAISPLVIGFIVLVCLGITRWFFDGKALFVNSAPRPSLSIQPSSVNIENNQTAVYRRHGCSCTRPLRIDAFNALVIDERSSSLCSQYATLRGLHQRVIAISMYGPKENAMFSSNASVGMLYELIADMTKMYSGWILRVYHDASIKEDIICPIECTFKHVDFCNASALGNLADIDAYMPPKIWRFLPAADPLVDVMGSRDLDSPLAQRELDAVNEWLSSDKQWHSMRDHPLHTVPMLGGMWGFRPELNRTMATYFLNKMLNRTLVVNYGRRGDQTFLTHHIWPHIQNHLMAHDSYLCNTWYGKNSRPWPTKRPLLNETGCFVGCIRPCCQQLKHPFGECPMDCRPKDHPDWTMC